MQMPGLDDLGACIAEPHRRALWRELVVFLHRADPLGGALAGWVFHGTSLRKLDRIRTEGLHAGAVVLRNDENEWGRPWNEFGDTMVPFPPCRGPVRLPRLSRH